MSRPEFHFTFVSSLEKIFFDMPDLRFSISSGSMLRNEIHSFQLAAWTNGNSSQQIYCSIEIQSEIKDCISVFSVGYVPSMLPVITGAIENDDDFLATKPGMFPDPLNIIWDAKIVLSNGHARSFWFAVDPNGKYSGVYPITVRIKNESGNVIEELTYNLDIIDAYLPELKICNTGWFHGDCLAALHHVPLQSNSYFEILSKYMEIYVKFGHNMILTPVFTPPLDTAIGGERPTNQLVDIDIVEGNYHFSFSNLKRWIDLCLEKGIKYFEISHFFTQWGAKYAPKIMATVDGSCKQLFGWETEATSSDYSAFLGSFLPELLHFLSTEEIIDRCWFHISDEPTAEQSSSYLAAKDIVKQYVNEDRIVDALSDFELYEKGAVKHPIVANNSIQSFIDHNVTDLWTYYCVAQQAYVSNRFMAMPAYRNRAIGWQIYKYNIRGFLQWGFNFWFSQYSLRVIDPYCDTTAGGAFPSGDAFLVYPLDDHGEVVCSSRLFVFNESMQDIRALELLEELAGRKAADKYLSEFNGFSSYPRSSEFYIHQREKINYEIKALCNQTKQY